MVVTAERNGALEAIVVVWSSGSQPGNGHLRQTSVWRWRRAQAHSHTDRPSRARSMSSRVVVTAERPSGGSAEQSQLGSDTALKRWGLKRRRRGSSPVRASPRSAAAARAAASSPRTRTVYTGEVRKKRFVALVVLAWFSGCSSGTDITRTDDDVEAWVAEQKAGKGAAPELPPSRVPAQATTEPVAPATGTQQQAAPVPCGNAWNDAVEARLSILDEQGHGPDIGSPEWRHAVERKLGVQSEHDFPEAGTEAWCERIDRAVFPEAEGP